MDVIDATTIHSKVIMGYQGWFNCPGDGSANNQWRHWFKDNVADEAHQTVDYWPDVGECDTDELYLTMIDNIRVYSAFNEKTVLRHFKWMQDYSLDGVFLQRFVCELNHSADLFSRNQVLRNVQKGAETYGRVFSIMYDITGEPVDTLLETIAQDWATIKYTTESNRYLHHDGKPVIGLWGFGFKGNQDTPQLAKDIIEFFKNQGCYIVGGVPAYWRSLTNDSQDNPEWTNVFKSFDILSPWTVGRYSGLLSLIKYIIGTVILDKVKIKQYYMPVIFPGFSAKHLMGPQTSSIPRKNGKFLNWQALASRLFRNKMTYIAMFDEVDEGTAIYKCINFNPTDKYLQLVSQISKKQRGE